MRHRRKVFTARPGDVSYAIGEVPAEVVGVPVSRVLLARADRAGTLVQLADRRFAMVGEVVSVGSAHDLMSYARRRTVRCPSAADRRWLSACVRALADAPAAAARPVGPREPRT